jgi:ankyrin repeat protein
LHDAVFHDDIERVTTLLEHGHSVNEINEERVFGVRIRSYPYPYEYRVTPLYVAACRSDPDMVDYLLRRGADPNLPVSGPYTILGRAASMIGGSIDIHGTGMTSAIPDEIKLRIIVSLLDAGADPERRKYEGGETPLEICRRLEVPDADRLFTNDSRRPSR